MVISFRIHATMATFLRPKIRELDGLLRDNPDLVDGECRLGGAAAHAITIGSVSLEIRADAFHDGHPIDWNPRGNEETTPRELDTEFTGHLEFDSVGHTNGGFFECSPLSGNDVAKNIAVIDFVSWMIWSKRRASPKTSQCPIAAWKLHGRMLSSASCVAEKANERPNNHSIRTPRRY
jgi:hypothetical protein